MGVVARLVCNSVESFSNTKVIKLTPVVGGDDPHSEEIKAFFEATPSGNVELSVPPGDYTDLKSGDQRYLYIETHKHEDSFPWVFFVKSLRLDWATYVEFEVKRTVDNKYNSSKMSFTIRNETAAEQFQLGGEFYIRMEKVGDAS